MKKYDNIPGFPGYYISKRGWQCNTSLTEREFRSIIKLRESGLTNKSIIKRLNLKLSSPGISRIWKRYQMGYYDEVLKL